MRKIASLGLAAAISATALTIGAPTALAASCYGTTCSGLDPQATGCSADAVTLGSATTGDVTVNLRYSSNCGAAWVRIYGGPSDRASIQNSVGTMYKVTLGQAGGSSWSLMVNRSGTRRAEACGRNVNTNALACTGML